MVQVGQPIQVPGREAAGDQLTPKPLPDRDERLARRGGQAVGAAFGALAAAALVLAATRPGPLEWSILVVTLVLGGALAVEAYGRGHLAHRHDTAEQSYRRLLQGLSRSASPDAVVAAIVDELRHATGADHVIVTRARPDDGILEAILFAAAGDAPPGTTFLPAALLSGGDPEAVAATVAAHLREAYGLRNVLAVPLVGEGRGGRAGRVVGTLTVSRRTADAWPAAVRQLLEAAATEVATALLRVYAFQAAQARASLDGLTGLPNRRHFDDLGRALAQGRRRADRLGLLMIDIDHFKDVNDRYLHPTGDAVLRLVAQAITANIRAEDTPARYGGEEFAVVLRRASARQAVEVAERIRTAVASAPVQRLGIQEPVTVSIGVALTASTPEGSSPVHEESSSAHEGWATGPEVVRAGPSSSAPEPLFGLVERADRALFRAKRAGRDRIVVDGLPAPQGPGAHLPSWPPARSPDQLLALPSSAQATPKPLPRVAPRTSRSSTTGSWPASSTRSRTSST